MGYAIHFKMAPVLILCRFECAAEKGEKRDKISLVVSVAETVADALQPEDLTARFKSITKKRGDKKIHIDVSLRRMD